MLTPIICLFGFTEFIEKCDRACNEVGYFFD